MNVELAGRRFHLVIDEDGTPEPPKLPPGTILRRLTGADSGNQYLVQLDSPVECLHASTNTKWTLQNLIVWPRLGGTSLSDILRGKENLVRVGIANVISPVDPVTHEFDPSQTVYFALGYICEAE